MQCGLGLLLLACATGASAADHPTLIQAKIEMCMTCHEDLVTGHEFGHAPVEDDCTSCHEVTKGEEGTEITLMAPEPELCLVCHADLEEAAAGEVASPHAIVMSSCVACHQVHGGEHPSLLAEAPEELCVLCHDRVGIQPTHSDQLPQKADCLSCHLPHGGPNERMLAASKTHAPFVDGSCDGCHRKPFGDRVRLRNRGEKLCTACHGAFEVPEGGVAHAAITGSRGRAGCLNCHDPHMSDNPAMLIADGPGLCRDCHTDVGLLLDQDNVHPPAEDCSTCHTPHVSAEGRLLNTARDELCVGCHDTEDEELAGKHLGADLAKLDCNACHNPHGSEHGKLLARNLHFPVLDGCDSCHTGAHDELMEDGESALCLACHEMDEPAVPHAALEIARCADCHNPHASPNELLVARSGSEVCTDCHDSQLPEGNETGHGAIEMFGCQGCHLPHGGERPLMLRATGQELCLGCHGVNTVKPPADGSDAVLLDRFAISPAELGPLSSISLSPDKTIGHPTGGHPVRGKSKPKKKKKREGIDTTFEDELSCLTCHDPHKGTGGLLFRWSAVTRAQLCIHCHPSK
jgi:predicted CXXCH cytochrome family protein